MKKLLLLVSLPVIATGLTMAIVNQPTSVVFAEGETSEPQSSEPVTEEETALEEVKGWLSAHLDKQLVANIITWVSEAGVLTGLLGVYIKYRKFKGKTLEDLINLFKTEMKKWLEENFKKLSNEQILKITDNIKELENANETIMKVLVLMQDTSKKGRVALLDFLGSKTNNEEVKELAEEASNELEEEIKNEEEVKEAVEGDYKEIF